MQLIKYMPLFLLTALLACQKPADSVSPDGSTTTPPGSTSSTSGTPTAVGKPIGSPITQTIGPAGGIITTPDGRVRFTFPAGAISKETAITVQPVENKAFGGTGQGYQLTPTDLKLTKNAQVTWTYTPEDIDGSAPEALGIASQSASGVWQGAPNVTVDKANQTVTAPVTQLAHWAFYEQFYAEVTKNVLAPADHADIVVYYQKLREDYREDPNHPGDVQIASLSPCQVLLASRLVRWTINGVTDGVEQGDNYSNVGQITEDKTYAKGTYDAPPREPDNNPVAIGAEIDLKQFGHLILVKNIRIESAAFLNTGDGIDNNPMVGLTSIDTKLMGVINNQNATYILSFIINNFQGKGTYRINKEHSVIIALTERGEGTYADSYVKGQDWISGGGTITITEYNGKDKPVAGRVSGKFFLQKSPTLMVTIPVEAKFRTVPVVVPR